MSRSNTKQNPIMKLTCSASDQNVYFTYVCLINDINPNDKPDHGLGNNLKKHYQENDDNEPIQIGRTKALHELIESHKKDNEAVDVVNEPHNEPNTSNSFPITTSDKEREISENDDINLFRYKNPSILKLTKMKWLTEDRDGTQDARCKNERKKKTTFIKIPLQMESRSPSLSPTESLTSDCSTISKDSESNILDEKYLSTILRLDKEHNMFGLSNITIVGSKQMKKARKNDKPVFHQTAIVQVCCGKSCCKHRSNTDLPSSLKCGGCASCLGCMDPCCSICSPCAPPCDEPPCPPVCPKGKCSCKGLCPPAKCPAECSTCFGLKITLNRKPKFDPPINELTPRSSCILQKPLAARSCHHLPQCIPPSSCFPYLMPCFWPARSSAPCNTPARCFHNPPCPPPRMPKVKRPPDQMCPPDGKCIDGNRKQCPNELCPGNNPIMKKAIETRFAPQPTNLFYYRCETDLKGKNHSNSSSQDVANYASNPEAHQIFATFDDAFHDTRKQMKTHL